MNWTMNIQHISGSFNVYVDQLERDRVVSAKENIPDNFTTRTKVTSIDLFAACLKGIVFFLVLNFLNSRNGFI